MSSDRVLFCGEGGTLSRRLYQGRGSGGGGGEGRGRTRIYWPERSLSVFCGGAAMLAKWRDLDNWFFFSDFA